tara:strand:- start:5752 stop:7326 length:1575 start_codon:yes stop_codon:yes gene_type:complete
MAGQIKAHLIDTIRSEAVRDISTLQQTFGYEITKHNIPDVWSITQGEGVIVASLDTGCQEPDHEDLVGSIIRKHGNVQDGDGHGQHTIGTISANNNDKGIVGVAPLAQIAVYKVLGDDGSGTLQGVIDGIDQAVADGCDIINMSLGAPVDHPDFHDAIKRAYNAGIVIICAAGNSGDVGELIYPANYPETISVGAIDDQNIRAWFSQTGSNLDFMAPGVAILSTVPINSYQIMQGSSMACPWMSGVVALMISKHRKSGGNTPLNGVEDVREHLKRSTIDLDQAGKDLKTGWGLVDVKEALGMASPEPCPSPIPSPCASPIPASSASSASSKSSSSLSSSKSSKSSSSSGSSKSSASSHSSVSSKSSVSSGSSKSSSSLSSSKSSKSSSSLSSSGSSKSSASSRSSSSLGAAKRVLVAGINFNPPGRDRNFLNGEWIALYNPMQESVDMTQWALSDAQGNTYIFPDGFVIGKRKTVVLHTGSGTDSATDLYWNRTRQVWQNFSDSMSLHDASNRLIVEFFYSQVG